MFCLGSTLYKAPNCHVKEQTLTWQTLEPGKRIEPAASMIVNATFHYWATQDPAWTKDQTPDLLKMLSLQNTHWVTQKHQKLYCLCTMSHLPYHHIQNGTDLKSSPNDKILDWSKLKQSADDNFQFDENSRKFSKQVKNTVGKGQIARYEQFLLFHSVFKQLVSQGRQKVSLSGNGLTLYQTTKS